MITYIAERFILVVKLSVDMFSCEAYYQTMKLCQVQNVKFSFLTSVYALHVIKTLTDECMSQNFLIIMLM